MLDTGAVSRRRPDRATALTATAARYDPRVSSPAESASTARPLAPASALSIGLALVALYVVWGSTYLGIRIAVGSIPPYTQAAVRFIVAGAVLYLATIRAGDAAGDRPGRREWRDAAIIGGFLLAGGNGLVGLGETTVPSGVAALLVATMPLWVAVLGRFVFGVRMTALSMAGIVLGVAGVAVLVWPSGGVQRLDPVGTAIVLCAPILWATGSLYSRRAHQVSRPLVATAMQMFCGGALCGVVAIGSGEILRLRLDAITPDSLIALAYLITVGSLIGYTSFAWLLRVAPISLVATYAFVNPIVAVILGWLLLHEEVGPRTAVAGLVIVAAVALIVRAREREPHPPRPDEVIEAP